MQTKLLLVEHTKNGHWHCEDEPALVWFDGVREWWLNGKRHRNTGPAIYSLKGKHMEWWQHGQLHRLDGPAVIDAYGNKYWYVNGDFKRSELI